MPNADFERALIETSWNPAAWRGVAQSLYDSTGSWGFSYQSARPRNAIGADYNVFDHAMDPAGVARLPDYMPVDDTSPPLARAMAARGAGEALFLEDWMPREQVKSSTFCQEYLRGIDAGYVALVILSDDPRAPEMLLLSAPFGRSLSDGAPEALARVTPRLRAAAALYRRAWSADALGAEAGGLFEAQPGATIILGRDGGVIAVSSEAQALLPHPALLVSRRGVAAVEPSQARPLGAALARALGPGAMTAEVVLGPPEARLLLQLIPIGGRTPYLDMIGAGAVMVRLLSPFRSGNPDLVAWSGRLMRAFGLTQSEAAVVIALADGLSPTEISTRRGVSLSTVRTQIKLVMAKSALNSVARLILAAQRLR